MGEDSSVGFGELDDAGSAEDKFRRELVRIRKSASFRVGVHIITAVERPWRLIFLPFSLPWLIFSIGLERLGKKAIPEFEQPIFDDEKNRKSEIMFPTNGVGFGHFTRLLSIARRIKKLDEEVEVIFFTTMPTLHLLKREGIPAYHLPGRKKFNNMPAKTWNKIVEENIANVFAIHKPSMFIFDGAFPYRGMLNSIQGRTEIKKVWLRRGTLKKGSTKIPIDSINHFDYIITPKDSVELEEHDMEFRSTVVKCDPILYLDEVELRPKEDLRNRLGIPHDAIVCYLQLGAGEINDIDTRNDWLDWVGKYGKEIKTQFKGVSSDLLEGLISSIKVTPSFGKNRDEKTLQVGHILDINFKLPIVKDSIEWIDDKKKSKGYNVINGKKKLRLTTSMSKGGRGKKKQIQL